MTQKKIDHKRFLNLAAEIAAVGSRQRFVLDSVDLEILLEHYEWFANYRRSRQAAGRAVQSPGRKPMPDAQIKPASLARREQRKKIQ